MRTFAGLRAVMIDNYDSFTYNLVQYFGELKISMSVVRNDAATPAEILAGGFDFIVISPGPSDPDQAGMTLPLIAAAAASATPLLGVCLGHQALGQAFGGKVVRADSPRHGKVSPIHHTGRGVFRDLPDPFEATRYHSLVVERATLPGCLEISAWTADGTIMGLRHREQLMEGVQFHPESVLTRHGHDMLANFAAAVTERARAAP